MTRPYNRTMPKLDLTGHQYGRLTVIKQVGVSSNYQTIWLCKCDCGNETRVRMGNLRSGAVQSCGCLRSEFSLNKRRWKGLSQTPEFNAWKSALYRCTKPTHQHDHRYLDRGIRMCLRWSEDFFAFLEDMGKRPSDNHSIDRINNDGMYSCGKCSECVENGWSANCRWATEEEQHNNTSTNRKITAFGKILSVSQWARETGIPVETISHRIRKGKWDPEKALTKPPRPSKYHPQKGNNHQ